MDWDTKDLSSVEEDSLSYLESKVKDALARAEKPYRSPEDVVNAASEGRARKGVFARRGGADPENFVLARLECIEWQGAAQETADRKVPTCHTSCNSKVLTERKEKIDFFPYI